MRETCLIVAGLAVLSMLLLYLVFREGDMGSLPGRQPELQTFQSGNGWGYQILLNEKVLIYQPSIPSIDSVMPFPSEESARKIGTLVIEKLNKNQNFSITKEDIQHSLSYIGQ